MRREREREMRRASEGERVGGGAALTLVAQNVPYGLLSCRAGPPP